LGLGAIWPAMSAAQESLGETLDSDLPPRATPATGPHSTSTWKGAFVDSLRLLILEHTGRIILQGKTRRELQGPFVRDYLQSVRWPRQWADGDHAIVNYVGHPIHGAAASRIWLDHTEIDRDPPLAMSKSYWASRSIAAAWAAGYSIQFEVGILSEASIGNVGRRPEHSGWVDHIVTPVGALALTVAEDTLDQYVIELIERSTGNRVLQIFVRIALNPSRSLANVAQGRTPWFRITRSLR
jgi:hypothetical protein